MVTYQLRIAEQDVWFVQHVFDSAGHLCLIDKTFMENGWGIMSVHLSDEAEEDFLWLAKKTWTGVNFTWEKIPTPEIDLNKAD